jgi:hypothetical protein
MPKDWWMQIKTWTMRYKYVCDFILDILHLLTLTVVKHQDNFSRITYLRDLERKLDDQIKSIVQTLADTRKELKEAKFTEFSKDAKRVNFDQLLQFAQNISRYTAPPGHVFPEVPKEEDAPEATEESKNVSWGTLTTEQQAAFDNISRSQFVPWPNQENIVMSLLSRIQHVRDEGGDPAVSGIADGNPIESEEQPPTSAIQHDFPHDIPIQSDRGNEHSVPGPSTQPQRPVQPAFEGFDF